MKKDQDYFDVLRVIKKKPKSSQRELAEDLGFSLGKLNYCLQALKKKGLIKIENFEKNPKKINYLYILTPKGISIRAELAINFMKRTFKEYDELVLKSKQKLFYKKKIDDIYDKKLSSTQENKSKKKRSKKLFKTIKVNIKRRTVIVNDVLSFYDGKPIPSWIELSIIDVCNRSCSFCPKSDSKVAPNTYQRMQMILIDKLTQELKEIKYKGSVVLCGYGEPMLHKEVNLISKRLSGASFVEVVTNGDTLTPKKIKELYNNNVNKLLISLYDGKFQISKFKKMIKESAVPSDFVILRDRWYDTDKDYGLKLTNRTGTVQVGDQEKVGTYTNCYYPSYQMLIDWNGDVFLCPQDWQRRIAMGNIMQEHIFDIWNNGIMNKYRKNLLLGKRCQSPCNLCNANGTILGKKHAAAWKKIYKI